MQCVIISFDSLATNSLGCYGNEWIETPNWDRIASTGAVFDRHFVDSLGPLTGMSWGTGQHPHLTPQGQTIDLATLLRSGKITSKLIVDGECRPWQQTIPFDHISSVTGREGADVQPDETPFAQVVKAACSAWNEPSFQQQPRLLWLHSSGPGVPPTGFDELYFEDFEERGQSLAELSDEDRAQHPAVYAGSVSLIDHWLGEILNTIENHLADQPTLLIVTAARGYLWQKAAMISTDASQLFVSSLGDQLARIPLVLKVYDSDRFRDVASVRSNRLVQACDLVPTLCDWFELAPVHSTSIERSWLREVTEQTRQRESLFFRNADEHVAVRTRDWLCIAERNRPDSDAPHESSPNRSALFVKPDDVWDINNVASQHQEIVDALLESIPPAAR